MREGWGKLFTSMGKRLDAEGAEEFKKLFTEVLDTESLISLMTIYIVDNFKDLLKGEINSPVFDSWYESGGLFFQKIKKILIESEKILTLAR